MLIKSRKSFNFFIDCDNYSVNADKQAQVANLQAQIDTLVYDLYGLTADEVKVIEGA